ncbi:uncharacterized protein LOC141629637 [Silene latifolia]|uniref:uncharacterized protein LOC141629637 n=1 Tax=Silene latifolia TaxID=37657 RepID=UPI003D7860BC
MGCISSSWFSLKINGATHGFFKGRSGLRQGDPLSPYLFVLSMEVLSRYLRVICSKPSVSYHPKCSRIGLTHLIFADDLMIFTRGDVPSVQEVLTTLNEFAAWTGLHANTEKTEIYFGGVQLEIREEIKVLTGFTEGNFPFRYLGLPLNTTKNTIDKYGMLITKVHAAVQHWSSTLLSYAGKVQLLSSVVFGLENFWCSSGLLPKSIIKLIDQMCKNFFWGIEHSHRKLVPKSWKSICSPRVEGGFGIKELLSWNKALVSKWVWKLTLPSTGIWCNWTTTYPLHNGTIWDISAKDYFSESLNSIIAVKNDLIHATGSQAAAQTLLHSWCANGKFHTHLAYDWFRPKFVVNTMFKLPFGQAVEPKKAIIASLALQKRLTTVDILQRRGIIIVNRCTLCKSAAESHSHLFFKCPYSQALWGGMLVWMKLSGRSHCYVAEFKWCAGRKTKKHWKHAWFVSCLVGTLYALWAERNSRIFRDKENTVEQALFSLKFAVSVYMLHKFPTLHTRIGVSLHA